MLQTTGGNATIGLHWTISNATNSAIAQNYESETVGATDTTAETSNLWIINMNIINKYVNTGLVSFAGTQMWQNATWDSNGVLLAYSVWLNSSVQEVLETISRGTFLAVPPSAPHFGPLMPNPSLTGNITLSWTAPAGATSFCLYCYSSPITTLNGSVTLVGNFTTIGGQRSAS